MESRLHLLICLGQISWSLGGFRLYYPSFGFFFFLFYNFYVDLNYLCIFFAQLGHSSRGATPTEQPFIHPWSIV